MVSEAPVISWTINGENMFSEPATLTESPPAYTSILNLTKKLATDDKVYTCTVQATTESEIAVMEVFLNFYCKSLFFNSILLNCLTNNSSY